MAGGVTYNEEWKGVGDMLYFAVALDDEKIRRDGIINTEGAYKCITDTFAARGVVLLKTVCGIRYYTRDIDKHDFEYLWMVVSALKKEKWFHHYVRVLTFYALDDDNCRNAEIENLLDEWESRATLEDVIREMEEYRKEKAKQE